MLNRITSMGDRLSVTDSDPVCYSKSLFTA